MAGQNSLWRRVSSLFRAETDVPAGERSTHVEAADEPGGALATAPSAGGDHPTRWWRRSARSVQVREVSLRVVELAQALKQHFEQQDQRAAEVGRSLNRVSGILEQLADAQRGQGEYLRSIAEHTEAAGKNASALTATLGRMPESLMAQAEAIRTVARSLELAQEADTQLMHSLQQFGRAVDTLGSSGTAQVDALQRLSAAQQEQHQAFAALVREQGRRFMALLAVVGVLAVAATVVLVVLLVARATG